MPSNQIDETAYYVDDDGKSLWGQPVEVIRARHAKLDAMRKRDAGEETSGLTKETLMANPIEERI